MNCIICQETLFRRLQSFAGQKNQRACIVYIGDESWLGSRNLHQSIERLGGGQYIDPSSTSRPENDGLINRKNFRTLLGTEQAALLFEAYSEFNVDAFAALSGTIPSGGLLVLSLSQSLIEKSPFCQRFIRHCLAKPHIFAIQQISTIADLNDIEIQLAKLPKASNPRHIAAQELPFGAKTEEQKLAVEQILGVVSGHRNRPLVITADRGRGKSTGLALAAATLIESITKPIVITAPHPDSVSVFFSQLAQHVPNGVMSNKALSVADKQIKYVPIDVLLANKVDCQLLLVDEAAGFPLPMLRQLRTMYSRIVFVSTIHGYEGAGRGFSHKFLAELKQAKVQSKHLHLNQPIRWGEHDQLEQLLFESLSLNAQFVTLPASVVAPLVTVDFRMVTNDELVHNEAYLNEIFALLVSAHYQTKPSDLQLLLDDPNIRLLVAEQDSHIVGVCLMLVEGDIEKALVQDIDRSLRRIKGHFLPQSLLVHCSVKQAFDFSYWRIVRIAIHPQRQGEGLGCQLLSRAKLEAKQANMDFIGTSFGANEPLYRFWSKNQFQCARLGFNKDAASGEHSALMLHSLNRTAANFQRQIIDQFYEDIPVYLCDEYKQVAPLLVKSLLVDNPRHAHIKVHDLQAMDDYIRGYKILATVVPAVGRWLLAVLPHFKGAQYQQELALLIGKFLQKRAEPQLIKAFNLTGKKALNKQLKTALKTVLNVALTRTKTKHESIINHDKS